MDANEVQRAVQLLGERDVVVTALDNIDQGGHIDSMTIGGDSPVSIDTTDVDYPPQMVDAIRMSLRARRDAVEKQLSDLGVTVAGIEPQAASQATPASHSGRRH